MFDKLKSFFIVDDGQDAKSGSTNKQSQGNTPSQNNPQASQQKPKIKIEKPVFDENNPPKGKPNEKFVNILLGAIEKNNVEGFDYLEFKQALQNLGNVEMDEGTKYQSALAMAKTMGADRKILFDSANLYLDVLNKEEDKFMESFSKQVSLQVNSRNSDLQNTEKGIALKKKQIAQLQKEIEQQEKSLAQLKETANQANAKVEATKDSFYHAYHIVTSQIKNDIEKMKTYLK